ncbi:MAG: hypothetical protein K0Q48_2440, partial [Bacillota bacterium]|nr:hypothetical protein [Bacillota bacterium]
MNIAAEFIHVNKRFPNATYHALDDVDLEI